MIEPHVWVTVGHMFSTFVTLSLPAAFFVFALVFAVQRWTLARTGACCAYTHSGFLYTRMLTLR